MATDTLELIELDVDLEAQVPCFNPEHSPSVEAKFRITHPSAAGGMCHVFLCKDCAKNCERTLIELLRHIRTCRKPQTEHVIVCNPCGGEVEPHLFNISPLGN